MQTEARIADLTARLRKEDLPLVAAIAVLWYLLHLPVAKLLVAWLEPVWMGPWA